jgi:hypothetical protein
MYKKAIYNEAYKKTQRIDVTNRIITLSENTENKKIPYQQYSKIQLRLFDSSGEGGDKNINTKLISGMKALIVIFDVTNPNTFKTIRNNIENAKNFFEESKKGITAEDKVIKQPDLFKDIPIMIVGNKLDMGREQKIKKNQVDEFILNFNKENNFSLIKYYEISVKENTGIDNIFQDIIFYYFKRKIDTNALNKTNNSDNSQNKINISYDENEIKEDNEKGNNKNKKPSLDKGMFVFHQMINKMKKQVIKEINELKEEKLQEINKNKKLEEKIDLITNNFNQEKNEMKEKINLFENKTNELENEIKNKNKEIEDLKKQLNEYILSTKDITLKFKINDESINDEISINAKGETKVSEVLGMLYELCPYINNMDIKGFCIDGKEDEKIDEMKTVNENKLVNGSLIVLIV